MTDINTAVQEAMDKLSEDGSIQKVIENQLLDTVKSIVNGQLRSYSPFGKALEEKISKDLSIDLSHVTFTEYNKVILNLVEGHLNKVLTGEAEKKLRDDLEEIFESPPKKITLSELIEKYKEECNEYDRDDADRIALIIEEKEYGSVAVALNPKNTKGYGNKVVSTWQDCDLYISVRINESGESEGKVSHTYDRSGLKPHQFMPTAMSSTARLLYQMYCAGSVFVFDQGMDGDDYDLMYDEDY